MPGRGDAALADGSSQVNLSETELADACLEELDEKKNHAHSPSRAVKKPPMIIHFL